MKIQWFALYIKQGSEKKVSEILNKIEIENYLPLNKTLLSHGSNEKIVTKPLFVSYLFVRVTEFELSALKKVKGVINFVYWLGKPVFIDDSDIITMRNFVNNYTDIEIEKVFQSNLEKKFDNILHQKDIIKVMVQSLKCMLVAQTPSSNVRYLSSDTIHQKSKIIPRTLISSAQNYLNSFI